MQQSYIPYYHLQISVEAPTKFSTLTIREISQNVGFLCSVFPVYGLNGIRIFPYMDQIVESATLSIVRENAGTILSIYGKIRIRESPHFGILHAMSNNQITFLFFFSFFFFFRSRYTPSHFRFLIWRKDVQNSGSYLCVYLSYKKAKMLWEWYCLAPCRNPRRNNTAQMDFFREENKLNLKLTPVFELASVCIFWNISV